MLLLLDNRLRTEAFAKLAEPPRFNVLLVKLNAPVVLTVKLLLIFNVVLLRLSELPPNRFKLKMLLFPELSNMELLPVRLI